MDSFPKEKVSAGSAVNRNAGCNSRYIGMTIRRAAVDDSV
jgi:hypothetical protein